jgi:hypothetical protein
MYYFVATSMMIKVGVYTVEHPRKKEKKANKQERESEDEGDGAR